MPYCPLRRSPIAGPPRLACLIHAANVRSEPGSNPSKSFSNPTPVGTRFFSSVDPPLFAFLKFSTCRTEPDQPLSRPASLRPTWAGVRFTLQQRKPTPLKAICYQLVKDRACCKLLASNPLGLVGFRLSRSPPRRSGTGMIRATGELSTRPAKKIGKGAPSHCEVAKFAWG